jgi:hypothetical protein
MNLTLLHGSLEPLIYGVVIFLGLVSMTWKLRSGRWLAFFSEVFVFWLVFSLHGHSMTGGFAATIASLLAGIFIPLMFRSK